MVADADIAHGAFLRVVLFDGYAERLHAVCCGNVAAVAIGLFDVVVMVFQIADVEPVELLIPLYGTEVGGRKQYGGYRFHLNRK